MRAALAAVALATALSSYASAQNAICPTAPVGDSSNRCASTAFVKNATSGTFIAGTAPINASYLNGVWTIGLNNENANTVSAGPASGSPATPTYRALLSADLPSSPTFTGTVRAPTPATDTNDTVVPTESWVHSFVASALNAACSTSTIRPSCISLFGRINAQWFGAVGDGVTDDGAAINAAFTACGASGGGIVQLPQTTSGIYITDETITTASGCTLVGTGGGSNIHNTKGVILKAGSSLPTSTALVSIWDTTHGGMNDIILDCAGIFGCYGIGYNSDNNPITTLNTIKNVSIQNAHIGLACGQAYYSPLAITAASVSGSGPYTVTFTVASTLPWAVGSSHGFAGITGATPSAYNQSGVITVLTSTTFTMSYAANPGTYTSGGVVLYGNEADYLTLDHVFIESTGTDTSATGIQLNSSNCLQESTITHLVGEELNTFFNGLISNGLVRIENSTAGSFVGTTNSLFKFGNYYGGNYILINNESEGPTGTGNGHLTYALYDTSGTSVSSSGVKTLLTNQFFAGSVLINGGGSYVSEGNTYASAPFSAPAVCSIADSGSAWTGNTSCGMQGVGEHYSAVPSSPVTVTNTMTTVADLATPHLGTFSLQANLSIDTASALTNVICQISQNGNVVGQAKGYGNTTSTTNISLSGYSSEPSADFLLQCQTLTSAATVTVDQISQLGATRVNN